MSFHRPTELAAALAIRAGGPVRILAGGTDFYPALRDGPVDFPVLDTTAIAGFRHIRKEREHWSFGANATWSDVQRAKLPPAFACLKQAAREVGSQQIQNRATLAGNLCNASPAADGVPPLLTLDAEVEIVSAKGTRREALATFITGNRKTTLASDEIVSRILVPHESSKGASAFRKLGARKYLVISIAMVAVRLEVAKSRITKAAIAVGACSPTAKRLPALETALSGLTRRDVENLVIEPDMLSVLSPIDDVRAPAAYRLDAVTTLLRHAMMDALP